MPVKFLGKYQIGFLQKSSEEFQLELQKNPGGTPTESPGSMAAEIPGGITVRMFEETPQERSSQENLQVNRWISPRRNY